MMHQPAGAHSKQWERRGNLTAARLATWLCPLGLNVFLVWFGSSTQEFVHRPGFDVALACLQPLGGVFYCAGMWFQARGTIRNNGEEGRSPLIFLGFLLSLIGLASSAHRR